MKRVDLFEFHDLTWFPRVWRDMLTEYLAYVSSEWGAFHSILPKLKTAAERSGSERIVDLCSGASGPLIKLGRHIYREDGSRMPVLLTDKFPNRTAFGKVLDAGKGALQFEPSPIDAMDVPAELNGFRTIFAAFHHFTPPQATRILRDAVEKGAGIGVFEYTERNRFWLLRSLRAPLLFWRTAPEALKPLTPSRVFWTYVLPLPVLLFMWDSVVSCLRTYTEDELKAMTETIAGEGYEWDIGNVPSLWGGRVTYLIGLPRRVNGTAALRETQRSSLTAVNP